MTASFLGGELRDRTPQAALCGRFSITKVSVRARALQTELCQKEKQPSYDDCLFLGGDKRDRTADLLNAIQALSQLSYTPIFDCAVFCDRSTILPL